MRARDCSNYTDDNIEALLAQWYAEGDRLVIIQAFPPSHRNYPEQQRQIAAAVAQGFVWDAYIYEYFGAPDWRARALEGIAGTTPRLVWMDDEEETVYSLSPQTVVSEIQASEAAIVAAGFRAGVYTRKSWWEEATANSSALSHLPLWDADYDGRQHTEESWAPYGGWTSRAIKQFAGSQPDGTDLNVLSAETEAEVLALLNPPTEEEMPIPQEYVDKFHLAGPHDIGGLIANFEGVIRTTKEIAENEDVEAEHKVEQIKALVNA